MAQIPFQQSSEGKSEDILILIINWSLWHYDSIVGWATEGMQPV